MADISVEITKIEQASRGEEVRDAIIDSLKKVNSEQSGWEDSLEVVKKTAEAAAVKTDVDEALEKKQDVLTFDEAPTEESDNPVKSKGILKAISEAVAGVGADENTTYTLSLSGNVLNLTPSSGEVQSVTLPSDGGTDTNTTYTLALEGDVLTLTPSDGGEAQSVILPSGSGTGTDTNTTYTLSLEGNILTLTPSSGEAQSVTLPTGGGEGTDSNTTYTLSITGTTLTLTPSSGDAQEVTIPQADWTATDGTAVLNKPAVSTGAGKSSVLEGGASAARGDYGHAEGENTSAYGRASHAEGLSTAAAGQAAHSEGYDASAYGIESHAEGFSTIARGEYQHVSGKYNVEDTNNVYAEIIGNGTSSARSNARTLDWSGNEVLAGKLTVGTAPSDDMDAATKKYVDEQVAGASGGTSTSADWSVTDSTAAGYISNKPAIKAGTGTNSILEGSGKTASDSNCHAEGAGTVASKADAHAEGGYTTASGYYSHAEGQYSEASGSSSHAEGMSCKAQGMYSHAEGNSCTAASSSCHAEGNETQAKMSASHAEGYKTLASSNYQHVSGKFNVEDTNTTYAEIIGNGTSNTARSNARTLDWSGNEVLAGKLTVGAAPENDLDVATKKYVDDLIASLQATINELSEKVNGTAS